VEKHTEINYISYVTQHSCNVFNFSSYLLNFAFILNDLLRKVKVKSSFAESRSLIKLFVLCKCELNVCQQSEIALKLQVILLYCS
jgi:hypothetical protein